MVNTELITRVQAPRINIYNVDVCPLRPPPSRWTCREPYHDATLALYAGNAEKKREKHLRYGSRVYRPLSVAAENAESFQIR